MREIKFRAWDGEEMYEWFHVESVPARTIRDVQVPEYFRPVLTQTSPIAIMQYTGLQDKNGVDIYESDLVKVHDHPTGTEDHAGLVVFRNGMFTTEWRLDIPLSDYGKAWVEVIGNIYESPDLLEDK